MNHLQRNNNRLNVARLKNIAVKRNLQQRTLCPNCGEYGPHFIPPSFGDEGFYACKKKEVTK